MGLRDDPDAMRRYKREWIAARRAEFFKDKSCAVCGSTDDLELDHIDPTTKVTHNIWSYRAEIRQAELAKCQVLCRVHHDYKTAVDGSLRRGERSAVAKLNESAVRDIRAYVAAGGKQSDMARKYRVDRKTIHFVVHRKTWTHI